MGTWCNEIWHEGDVVPFDLRDRGLLLGDGVFDTALILAGRMVWRQPHVDRLLAAVDTLGFRIDPLALDRAIDAILARMPQGSIRLTVTRGAGPRGIAPPDDITPTIIATAGPLPTRAIFAPIDLHVTRIRRNETSPASRIKSLAYLDGVLAQREALAAGCHDALFLNMHDRVACTSMANVFAQFGKRLVTPPLADGILDGVVRRVLLRSCDAFDLEPIEKSMSLTDLEAADTVFVTNSLRLLAPVMSIAGKSAGAGLTATIIDHLTLLVGQETGVDPRTLGKLTSFTG